MWSVRGTAWLHSVVNTMCTLTTCSEAPTTKKAIDPLDKFVTNYPEQSMRQLSTPPGFHPTTLGAAKSRGQLSPTVGGMIARAVSEDVKCWVTIAGLEAEKQSAKRDQLLTSSAQWRRL
ncbi:MAG: hypothetical protein HY020_20055 [Burkholderiales bacterium]|nr:hypothetical protein [Burkholderiales bacterium]